MTAYDELAQRYIDTWNETDPSARRAAVDQLYTEDARYVDPLAAADGPEAIASMIGAVQQQFPEFSFRLAGPVDGHHNQARFAGSWAPRGHRHRSWASTSPSVTTLAASRPCWDFSTRFLPRSERAPTREEDPMTMPARTTSAARRR